MKTFFDLWQSHVKSAGYTSINAFLRQHDPKGSAYQTMAKKGTSIPAHERVSRWSDLLGLTPMAKAEWLDAAERDRAIAASSSKELGPGIRLLKNELTQARADLARYAQENAELRAVLRDIAAKVPNLGLNDQQLKALGLQDA